MALSEFDGTFGRSVSLSSVDTQYDSKCEDLQHEEYRIHAIRIYVERPSGKGVGLIHSSACEFDPRHG